MMSSFDSVKDTTIIYSDIIGRKRFDDEPPEKGRENAQKSHLCLDGSRRKRISAAHAGNRQLADQYFFGFQRSDRQPPKLARGRAVAVLGKHQKKCGRYESSLGRKP